jgi:primosomal protein N' (replication factor Y)
MYLLNVAVDVPLYRLFSYYCTEKLAIGTRVAVPFGSKTIVGFVWDNEVTVPDINPQKIKSILEIFPEVLATDAYQLINFTANYYHYPIGQVLFGAIPKEWRRALAIKELRCQKPKTHMKDIPVALNNEQQDVVNQITQNLHKYYPSILYGVTGSGKTEVYLSLIDKVISIGMQALVLVPEINLTPQLLERFLSRFPTVGIHVLTSSVTSRERLRGYLGAAHGTIQIIIGTRLSVFTPFKHLGLILVDEEHDHSFKQQESLRYHARDLAIWRAAATSIPIVLGSATPSLETLYNYKLGKYKLFKLPNRAVEGAELPDIRLIDLNVYKNIDGLTDIAINEISKRLLKHELSLVFINRRGYAPSITCYQCGYVFTCKNCSTNLVYHSNSHKLKCHHCSVVGSVPKACPACNSQHLQALGQGTQKIEEVLTKQFPAARIYRIDQDVLSSKAAWSDLYAKIKAGEIDILVGTQILVKGHDFHNLTLVIGLNIDSSLYSYDFRASELLFTQLTQVAGRAGRGDKKGLVLLQTNYPKHELYQYLLKHDFAGFINHTMRDRRLLNLPPYAYYAILRASGNKLNQVLEYLNSIRDSCQSMQTKTVRMNPPVPAIMQRLKSRERGQVLIISQNRAELHSFITSLTDVLAIIKKPAHDITWQLDIDPFEM